MHLAKNIDPNQFFLYLVLVWLPTCIISYGRLPFVLLFSFLLRQQKFQSLNWICAYHLDNIFFFFHPQCIWLGFNLLTLQLSHIITLQLSHIFTLQLSQIWMSLLFQISIWFIFDDIKLCKLGPLHYNKSKR